MTLLFWGLTISTLGKVLLAAGVLMAHHTLAEEHRIDVKVLRTFKTEQWLTAIGVLLILSGYTLEIMFYGFTPFYDCPLGECDAQLPSVITSQPESS